MTELSKLKEMLADLKSRIDAFEKGGSEDFEKVAVDGVDYYDSKKDVTHQDALGLAAKYGLRVLERWELSKLFDESEEFSKSLVDKWYRSASVVSFDRNTAWQFNGGYGSVASSSRDHADGVRCVLEASERDG